MFNTTFAEKLASTAEEMNSRALLMEESMEFFQLETDS